MWPGWRATTALPRTRLRSTATGGNDIAMLKRFRHSYATKNASDAAKAAASATIGSCMVHAVPKHMLATMHKQSSRTIIE